MGMEGGRETKGLVLTAEEIKGIFASTALWLREGLGDVGAGGRETCGNLEGER